MSFQWDRQFQKRLRQATPGFRLGAYWRGQRVLNESFGRVHELYDWASLTKPIFTVSALMALYERGALNLRESVTQTLPWCPHPVSVADLLSHRSGLRWWFPFFEKMRQQGFAETNQWPRNWSLLAQSLRREKLEKQTKRSARRPVYSDLNFWLLGFYLERRYERPLFHIWQDLSAELGLKTAHFSAGNRPLYRRTRYAPTEKCPWRQKTLRGEVHDDNTWSLGGVAPHAGLFGSMADLSRWALELRRAYRGQSSIFSAQTVKTFFKTRAPGWALGFMTPTPPSSAGRWISSQAVGHLAFTGPSFWYDLRKDLIVLILTNRVHPTRENNLWAELRPALHEQVFAYIEANYE